jgi:type IV secretory pathway TraG/TraD family ATPase VirD4
MSASSSRGGSDAAMLAAIGSALAIGLVLWLWGSVAGLVFGSGWPRIGAMQTLAALSKLPAHLADPAAAWPTPVRSRLPGPMGFYAALLLVCVGGAAPALMGVRLVLCTIGRGGRPGPRASAGARWARASELRVLCGGSRLRVRSGSGARVALGRRNGRLLHAEDRHALIAFGPPQSGKSAGLAVPALLEWIGPAVASSIKTDLLTATVLRRSALGTVFVFDPFALSRVASNTWSPLHAARTWDGALEVAWRLATAGELDQRGVEGGDFWAIAAEQRLAPLLYAAAGAGAGIEAVVRWAYGQRARELHDALAQMADRARDESELAGAHAAYDAVRAFEAQADRTRSSIEATAQALLRAYRFRRVAASARSCEITADRLLDEAATLYLIGDAKASKLLRPIFLTLLSEIVDRAYQRATLAGGRLERPLLLCLDEAGNVAPLPNLAEVASTAPSHNIQLVSIFHDLAQARTRYGTQAETAVNSHRARMLLPGVADLETLRYFAGLAGEEEAPELTRTVGADGTTRSIARRWRPLTPPEALRQLPDGHALLLYGRIAPTQLRLRMWFADRRLRKLAQAT